MPPKLPMIEKTNNQVPSNGIHFSKTFPSTTNFPSHQTCVRVSFPPTMALRFPHGVSPDCLVGFRPLTRQTTSTWCNREVFQCPNPMKPKRGKVAWTVVVVVGTARPWSSWAVWGRNMLCFFLRGGKAPRFLDSEWEHCSCKVV